MKIERINENQIRCTLTSFDLSVRDLNLVELAYGSEKAKRLFREMIQKASNEVGFDAEDIPLMVEAIPLSAESIMLIITKIEDPEELDTRFSKFSMASEDENSLTTLTSELLEGADGLLELLSQAAPGNAIPQSAVSEAPKRDTKDAETDPSAIRCFTFQSLEEVCRAARIAGPVCSAPNALYKNPSGSRYYLIIHRESEGGDSFNRICNLLSEYGTTVKATPSSEAYYQEHYETIVKKQALQTLANL